MDNAIEKSNLHDQQIYWSYNKCVDIQVQDRVTIND